MSCVAATALSTMQGPIGGGHMEIIDRLLKRDGMKTHKLKGRTGPPGGPLEQYCVCACVRVRVCACVRVSGGPSLGPAV